MSERSRCVGGFCSLSRDTALIQENNLRVRKAAEMYKGPLRKEFGWNSPKCVWLQYRCLLSKGLQVQAKFLHARSHRKQSIGGYKCNIEDRAPLSAVLRYAVMSWATSWNWLHAAAS